MVKSGIRRKDADRMSKVLFNHVLMLLQRGW